MGLFPLRILRISRQNDRNTSNLYRAQKKMATLIPPSSKGSLAIVAADPGETPLDIPERMFVDAYKTFGALLLRGFPTDFDAFRKVTDRFCIASVFNESKGREVLDEELNIQTVNTGNAAFPLHPELSREPWKPDICFFWCMHAPSDGGETTVCDGVEVVKRLSPEVRDAFARRRLRYTRIAPEDAGQFWLNTANPTGAQLQAVPPGCPFEFSFLRDGQLVQSFTRPALHKPMFTGELAFGNFLLFGRYLKGMMNFPTFENGQIVGNDLLDPVKDIGDRLMMPVTWTTGDIVVLDNTRFMHGRNRITNTAERRIATYFGYLRFAIPDPEEGPDPLWRKPGFRPPT